jgi:organic hydroperoxide reductase OsmC/OhrA
MSEHTLSFEVDHAWNFASNSGLMQSGNRQPVAFGAPVEFGGSDMVWSPEHLLCASVASCFMTTFLHLAKVKKVIVRKFHVSSVAEFEKKEKGFVAVRYILKPLILVEGVHDKNFLHQLVEKAESHCFISNSVNGKVAVTAAFEFVEGETVNV